MYKRQEFSTALRTFLNDPFTKDLYIKTNRVFSEDQDLSCLLYTSDAADERSSVDLGGRRIIKKKNSEYISRLANTI